MFESVFCVPGVLFLVVMFRMDCFTRDDLMGEIGIGVFGGIRLSEE